MDLLTVVMHEMGHVLGLDDTHGSGNVNDLMYESLGSGIRRLPTAAPADGPGGGAALDAVFAHLTQGGTGGRGHHRHR